MQRHIIRQQGYQKLCSIAVYGGFLVVGGVGASLLKGHSRAKPQRREDKCLNAPMRGHTASLGTQITRKAVCNDKRIFSYFPITRHTEMEIMC